MDIEQIDNIFSTGDRQDVQYSDAQWLFLQDNNNQQYSQYVQFITTTLKTQFIDYHNAYVAIPTNITVATPANGIARPPYIAMRESVFNLIANQTVATDQGQTLYNDTNTMFINNIRLQVENSIDWLWSNGSDYAMAYDQYPLMASQTVGGTTNNLFATDLTQGGGGINAQAAGYTGNSLAQTGPSFYAPQGIEPGNILNAPNTNDLNEFGGYLNGDVSVVVGANSFTSIGGVLPAPTATLTSPGIQVTLVNGQTASVPISFTGTAPATTPWLVTIATSIPDAATGDIIIGGQSVASGVTAIPINAPVGVYYYTVAATGSASSGVGGNSAYQGQEITLPIQIWFNKTAGGAYTGTLRVIGIGSFTLAPSVFVSGATPVGTLVTGTINLPVTSPTTGRNPNFNKGFLDRVSVFQNSATFVRGGSNSSGGNGGTWDSYSYIVTLPLKLLHDFWMQLNIPIINIGFNIQLFFAQSNGNNPSYTYPPLQVGNNTNIVVGGGDATQMIPFITYGGAGLSGSGITPPQEPGQVTGCRLYYRSVKFSPADNARMSERLAAGFTKSIKFISTDWISPNQLYASGSAQQQVNVEQSVVHPLRVWVLSYPNTVTTTGSVTTGTSWLRAGNYASGVNPIMWSNTNMLVNNVPYWRQNFTTFQDMWEQLREQFSPDTGSMIRQIDWRNYKRYLCFDLTRLSDRLQSPTEPVSLIFTGQRMDGLQCQCEMIVLVERLNQITIRFSSSDVIIVVGNLD